MRTRNGLLIASGLIFTMAGTVCADVITLHGRIRDFTPDHPDFQAQVSRRETGIVADTLGPDGKPVYVGGLGISTSNQTNFDQWFNESPQFNMGSDFSIELDNTITPDPRIYTFDEPNFFPIDSQLLGNGGNPHNYHFTVELHGELIYEGGEVLNFTADDDLWVFINGKLAVDLGGVHRPISDSINLDAIAANVGLVAGQSFDYDLFYAERHTSQAYLGMEITRAVPAPAALPLLGLGVLIATGRRSRRRHARKVS